MEEDQTERGTISNHLALQVSHLNNATTQISRVEPLRDPRPGNRSRGLEKQLRSMVTIVMLMLMVTVMVPVPDSVNQTCNTR